MDDSADADVGIHVSRMPRGLSVMWPMIISSSGSKKKLPFGKSKKTDFGDGVVLNVSHRKQRGARPCLLYEAPLPTSPPLPPPKILERFQAHESDHHDGQRPPASLAATPQALFSIIKGARGGAKKSQTA